MSADCLDVKVTLFLNHVEFNLTYGELVDQWDDITDKSGYQETGGGWRAIGQAIDQMFREAREAAPGIWFSRYQPYSIPPVAIKILKDQ